MKMLRTGLYPAGRLHNGAAVLSAAKGLDVTLVQKRLDVFADVQQAYATAHAAVEAAEAQAQGRQGLLSKHNQEQDDAMERLARALINDGLPRRANPFALYGASAPSDIQELRPGKKAKVIHSLARTLLADPTVSESTKGAAQAADEAALKMEAELVPFDQLQSNLLTAREAREVAGKAWDKALNSLKRGARAAADEGAPELYAALFGRLQSLNGRRARKKGAKPEQTPASQETVQGSQAAGTQAPKAADSPKGA